MKSPRHFDHGGTFWSEITSTIGPLGKKWRIGVTFTPLGSPRRPHGGVRLRSSAVENYGYGHNQDRAPFGAAFPRHIRERTLLLERHMSPLGAVQRWNQTNVTVVLLDRVVGSMMLKYLLLPPWEVLRFAFT
jgi:hypothetical protein